MNRKIGFAVVGTGFIGSFRGAGRSRPSRGQGGGRRRREERTGGPARTGARM